MQIPARRCDVAVSKRRLNFGQAGAGVDCVRPMRQPVPAKVAAMLRLVLSIAGGVAILE
jgi:hypothetical protein